MIFNVSVTAKSVRPTAKKREIFGLTIRGIATDDLNDIGRHGFNRGERVQGDLGAHAGGQNDGHRLADSPADGENERREHPGETRREDDPGRHLELGRAQPVRRLPQSARHGREHVFAERRYQGDNHHAHHDTRGERIVSRNIETERFQKCLERRRHQQEGHVSINNRGDSGEQLEGRLEHRPHRPGCVLAQVDRAQQANRQRDHRRAGCDHKRSPNQGNDSKLGRGGVGFELGSEQEFGQADVCP